MNDTTTIKKADLSCKAGISIVRLSQLSNEETTNLKVKNVYLIALAKDVMQPIHS